MAMVRLYFVSNLSEFDMIMHFYSLFTKLQSYNLILCSFLFNSHLMIYGIVCCLPHFLTGLYTLLLNLLFGFCYFHFCLVFFFLYSL